MDEEITPQQGIITPADLIDAALRCIASLSKDQTNSDEWALLTSELKVARARALRLWR